MGQVSTAAAGQSEMPRLEPQRKPRGAALRMGVIMGLGYRNLCGDLDRVTRVLDELPVPHIVVRNPDDVGAALDDFQESGMDVVAVSGGDGTVSMVATHLLNRKKSMPLLAVLEGGRTNMTAYDVGLRGDQIEQLQRLLKWTDEGGAPPFEIVERSVIAVSKNGSRPECGFFVGGGAVYEGSLKTWAFRDDSKLPGMRTGIGTGVSVAKLVAKHFLNRSAFKPSRQRIFADGKLLPEDRWCVTLASTLERLVFGIYPFWGEGEGQGQIRLTAVSADHRHLFRAGLAAIRAKTGTFNTPMKGYHSCIASEIDIELDGGVTLDGQIIHHEGPGLRLGIAGSLRFLRG